MGLAAILAVLGLSPDGFAQATESADAVVVLAPDSVALPSPRGALLRSLAAPGWGQVYVGQPVKTPFVVGAFGGLVGLTVVLNGRYIRYRHAYLYVSREDEDPTVPDGTNEFAAFFEDWVESGSQSATTNRSLRESARRNRDLAILGTAVVYALQALDAYVAAELTDFDVSEDLSIRMAPTPDGAVAVLSLRF